MKLRTIVCVLALAALASPGTAETRSPTKSGAGVQKVSPGVKALPGAPVIQQKAPAVDPKMATGKLEALKINPAVLKSLEPGESEPALDRVETSYEDFKKAKTSLVTNRRNYARKLRQCSLQSYTSAQQTAAGCEATDTVAECSTKLLRRCAARSYVRYVRTRQILRARAVALRRTVDDVTSIYVP